MEANVGKHSIEIRKRREKKRKERQQQPKKDNTILHNALQYSHTGPVKDKGYMCFTWS